MDAKKMREGHDKERSRMLELDPNMSGRAGSRRALLQPTAVLGRELLCHSVP